MVLAESGTVAVGVELVGGLVLAELWPAAMAGDELAVEEELAAWEELAARGLRGGLNLRHVLLWGPLWGGKGETGQRGMEQRWTPLRN